MNLKWKINKQLGIDISAQTLYYHGHYINCHENDKTLEDCDITENCSIELIAPPHGKLQLCIPLVPALNL